MIRLFFQNLKVRYLTWKYREMLLTEQMHQLLERKS